MGRTAPIVAALLLFASVRAALAYTAAGDRTFPATILLPQAAPADEFYMTPQTQPVTGGQTTKLDFTLDKTLTERLGVQLSDGYTWLGHDAGATLGGWQNLQLVVKYLAIRDAQHEALISLGVNREWGGTGAASIGAAASGATTPTLYFAKGLGDLDLGYLRPLALEGVLGWQFADTAPRSDAVVSGLALEYSIPYLQSKVRALPLPDPLRAMTPLVEAFVVSPTGPSGGSRRSAVLGPGVSYAGEGWEFAIEALVPLSRGAGSGPGVAAQLHFALDYFFPEAIGRPLFR
ncbi:MAG TPA: hypothetical protein VGR91_05040 [Stellaceae bacterium]|nr:hypothetical protein [Stellaceae bacterium]